MADPQHLKIGASENASQVSGLLLSPARATRMLVLGHGAGAGMRHPFLEALAQGLATRSVATLRYQFPYMEAGRRRPDSAPILHAAVRSAVATALELAGDLPLFAGGKSMGGRMTSGAAARRPLPEVRGLVFVGFPLHPAGKPATDRARHLEEVGLPMLFLQGTRDRLAELDLLKPVVRDLGRRASLHVVEGADHSFRMLVKSGRTLDDAIQELASTTADWTDRVLGEEAQ